MKWLRSNGVFLDPRLEAEVRQIKAGIINSKSTLMAEDLEWRPKAEEIRYIVENVPVRDKFIITALSESGMRPATLFRLRLKDIIDDIYSDKSSYAIWDPASAELKRRPRGRRVESG